jgi:hypothetical protein
MSTMGLLRCTVPRRTVELCISEGEDSAVRRRGLPTTYAGDDRRRIPRRRRHCGGASNGVGRWLGGSKRVQCPPEAPVT